MLTLLQCAIAILLFAATMIADRPKVVNPTVPVGVDASRKRELVHPLWGITCSPDGQLGICSYGGYHVAPIDVITGKISPPIFGTDGHTVLSYTSDGKYLIALGWETIIWDNTAGRVHDRITLPEPKRAAVVNPNVGVVGPSPLPISLPIQCLSPDGSIIYIKDQKDDIVIREIASRTNIGSIPTAGEILRQVAISPDGKKLVVVSLEAMTVWEIKTAKPLTKFKLPHKGYSYRVAFNADNNTLFGTGLKTVKPTQFGTAEIKHGVFLWDVAKGEMILSEDAPDGVEERPFLILSSDRSRAYLGTSGGKRLHVFDPRSGKHLLIRR